MSTARTLWRTSSFHPESLLFLHILTKLATPLTIFFQLPWNSFTTSVTPYEKHLRHILKTSQWHLSLLVSIDAMNNSRFLSYYNFLFYISKLLYVTVILYWFSLSPCQEGLFFKPKYRANILYLFWFHCFLISFPLFAVRTSLPFLHNFLLLQQAILQAIFFLNRVAWGRGAVLNLPVVYFLTARRTAAQFSLGKRFIYLFIFFSLNAVLNLPLVYCFFRFVADLHQTSARPDIVTQSLTFLGDQTFTERLKKIIKARL